MSGSGVWLEALERGPIGSAMRDSPWLFPAVETAHIIGFSILVGSVVLFDLRVLGISRSMPVRLLARHLLPWSVGALLLIVPTGLMMFSSAATELIDNPAFRVKLLLLILAGANAARFHLRWYRGAAAWDQHVPAPGGARLHAAASITLWLSIITCGRMIAYL